MHWYPMVPQNHLLLTQVVDEESCSRKVLGILVLQSWSLVAVVVEVEFMVVSSWRQRLFVHQA